MNDIRFTLAASRRILFRSGCDSGVAGHVSARAGNDGFWMTPFEYFDETTPETAVRLGWDLAPLDPAAGNEPSPAAAFHSVIYRRRPDVGAIVHIHSHYVCVHVSSDRDIGVFNVVACLFHGEQAHYVDDGTRPSVDGERMADELRDKRVLLMRNHGALVVGDTVEDATVLAMSLEQAARYDVECRAIGGGEIPELEVERLKRQYDKYFLPQMWQASLRRLRVSDPDLFTAERG